jgi:hypothetical protein
MAGYWGTAQLIKNDQNVIVVYLSEVPSCVISEEQIVVA